LLFSIFFFKTFSLAKAATGHSGGLTMRHAYHGITDAMASFTPALTPKHIAKHIQQLEPPHTYAGEFTFFAEFACPDS
jgi:4-aminobutyrate aminotransferase-like enzyme